MASVAIRRAASGSALQEAMRIFWGSPELISRRGRASAWLQQGWEDAVDGEQGARLHLVALACEIAVLARLTEQELPACAAESEAQEVRRRCCDHRCAAERLLSAGGEAHQQSLTRLCAAIDLTQMRLVNVRRLRERVTAMRPPKTSRRWPSRGPEPARAQVPDHDSSSDADPARVQQNPPRRMVGSAAVHEVHF
jgi:hypothetical protein